MYFLGLDPGIRKLGYALITADRNVIDSGIILLKSQKERDFDRLREIHGFFSEMMESYNLSSVGIEKLFFTEYNKANAEFVYGVRGALIVLFLEKGVPVYEYTPKELKKAITGNGNAGKKLMQNLVARIFNLQKVPQFDDAADALGIAYLVGRKNLNK